MSKKRVSRLLADGTVKVYEYDRKQAAPRVRTIDALILEYRATPEYRRLRPASGKIYDRATRAISEWYGPSPIEAIRRRHVKAMRDGYSDTPAIANQIIMVWSVILQLAVEQEYVTANVASRMKRLEVGEYARWTDEAIDHAIEKLPAYLARAVTLALYTGQREGDCIRMTWGDYDGSAIRLTQEKTGAKLWVPCHRALRSALDQWRVSAPNATTILVTSKGLPWKDGKSFSTLFAKVKNGHDALKPFAFHGLRKSAAARLAEAGCSVHEISAITGHMSLHMVQHYTREADQRRNAVAAVKKLEDYRR